VTPYRARKSYDRWMQDAGVPRVRRRQYLGHGKADVSDNYEFYEVTAYLKGDAEKMRSQLGPQRLQVHQGGAA
jgi:hypothetical protein